MQKSDTNIAIEVENLYKKYSLSEQQSAISIGERLKQLIRKTEGKLQSPTREFYALSNISFSIQKGETIGIIGKNGAGKSTLLKILSQVTEPSSGTVRINGSVASVLEIGTGFHPELSGRENVYLSGIMQGIPRKTIDHKFDAIVDFAGIHKFIETPVKHYSSGMYVRLAFAVAANIDADIMLFDEALSVGDYAFQIKCYEKIIQLARSNKTILIVSHNINDISMLCSKVMVLDKGQLTDFADSSLVVKYFEKSIAESTQTSLPVNGNSQAESLSDYVFINQLLREWPDAESAPGDDFVRIRKMYILNESLPGSNTISTEHNFSINIEYDKYSNNDFYDIGFIVSNMHHMFLGNHLGNSTLIPDKYTESGRYHVKMHIEKHFFNHSIISVGFGLYRNDGTVICFDANTLNLKIEPVNIEADSGFAALSKNYNLPLKPVQMNWEVNRTNKSDEKDITD